MKVAQRLDVIACERRDCPHTWGEINGATYDNSGWREAEPMRCEVLKADFCGAECHGTAHRDEAHGVDWRRKGRPIYPKRFSLRRRRR